MSVAFVMVIFFWESVHGYAVTNIPGYTSRALCEAAAAELREAAPRSYNAIRVVCIPGH